MWNRGGNIIREISAILDVAMVDLKCHGMWPGRLW
jgi:hypothetical protein